MKYSHVIWDWNGTIVDDARLCVDIVNKLLRDFNQKQVSMEFYLNHFRFPVSFYYQLIGLPTDSVSTKSLSHQFITNYRKGFASCKLQLGIIECLKKLKEWNINQSVLSAGNQADLNSFISFFKLSEYFDIMSGVNNFYANGKSHIAHEHFDKLTLAKSDVLLIGDTLHDAEIADDLGIDCLLYCGGHNSQTILNRSKFPLIESIDEVCSWVLD